MGLTLNSCKKEIISEKESKPKPRNDLEFLDVWLKSNKLILNELIEIDESNTDIEHIIKTKPEYSTAYVGKEQDLIVLFIAHLGRKDVLLEGFKKLKRVIFFACHLDELIIKHLPELEIFNLGIYDKTFYEDLGIRVEILNLKKLKKIDINVTPEKVTELILQDIKNLESFVFSGKYKFPSYELTDFPKLTAIEFSDCDLKQIKLSRLPQLKSLYLEGTNELSVLDLREFDKLEVLKLPDSAESKLELVYLNKSNKVFPGISMIRYISDEKKKVKIMEFLDENGVLVNHPALGYSKKEIK